VKLVAGRLDAIRLASTADGAALTLTATSGNTAIDTLTPAASFDPSAAHVRDGQIVFTSAHHLLGGERVQYRVGTGNSPIGGLTEGQPYYVIRINDTTIQLANTPGGTPIALDNESTAILTPVVTKAVSELLIEDLNELISGTSLYDAERFAGVTLRAETTQLLSQYPQGNRVLNRLLLEDAYPSGLPRIASVMSDFPAAVYFAQRFVNRAGNETMVSTVENVHVHLAGNNNAMQVDSTFGGATSIDGGTNTTITLASSTSGLHPSTPRRVAFLDGRVSLSASQIVMDDSGNDQSTLGAFAANQVTGLGMPGSVTLIGTPSTTVKLGANDDVFYLPTTANGQSVRLEAGGGYDTVYVHR